MRILSRATPRPAILPALVIASLAAASCAGADATPAAPAAGPPVAAASASPPCSAPENRQLDFWIGEWDVTVRARKSASSDEWGEAPGTQRIEKILGGCAVAEHFAAEGPGPRWAGASYAAWHAASKQWRQTWVDDQGSYLTFTGGVEGGAMALYGEPSEVAGERIQMRMIWLDVTPASLRWEWQRRAGEGAWSPQMIIQYRRRGAAR